MVLINNTTYFVISPNIIDKDLAREKYIEKRLLTLKNDKCFIGGYYSSEFTDCRILITEYKTEYDKIIKIRSFLEIKRNYITNVLPYYLNNCEKIHHTYEDIYEFLKKEEQNDDKYNQVPRDIQYKKRSETEKNFNKLIKLIYNFEKIDDMDTSLLNRKKNQIIRLMRIVLKKYSTAYNELYYLLVENNAIYDDFVLRKLFKTHHRTGEEHNRVILGEYNHYINKFKTSVNENLAKMMNVYLD